MGKEENKGKARKQKQAKIGGIQEERRGERTSKENEMRRKDEETMEA